MSRRKKGKKLIVLADLHCGHRVGLTPPAWHNQHSNPKWNDIQVELWGEYERMIERHGTKPHVLVVNGDAIEGRAYRSGSTELITADRNEQCKMAAYAINLWEAEHIIMIYGTKYHVSGDGEDYEDNVAIQVQADKIGGQDFVDINGTVFDFRHKIGNTSIPHGKGTQIGKQKLWNLIWQQKEEQPNSDVIIRSHVHNFFFCGDDMWLGMTTPALQGQGSKYGARECDNHVDFGIVHFDVNDDGGYTWGWDISVVETQKTKVTRL